jgi:hypothetical protein
MSYELREALVQQHERTIDALRERVRVLEGERDEALALLGRGFSPVEQVSITK